MFWNDAQLEVKKSFQWQGYIDFQDKRGRSLGLSTHPFLVSSWTKPKLLFDAEEITSKAENTITHIVKKAGFEPLTISIVDTINKRTNASNNVFTWLLANGFKPNSFSIDSDNSDSAEIFLSLNRGNVSLKLASIDHKGKEYEVYKFKKPIIASVDFGGTADYSRDEIFKVTLSFRYSSVIYQYRG